MTTDGKATAFPLRSALGSTLIVGILSLAACSGGAPVVAGSTTGTTGGTLGTSGGGTGAAGSSSSFGSSSSGQMSSGTTGSSSAGFDAGPPPTDIPLNVIYIAPSDAGLPGGASVLTLEFALGDGGPIEGILDTGSTGLQLLASQVPPGTQLSRTSVISSQEFPEAGVEASGYVASATVVLGDRATPEPIPIVVYDRFSCIPNDAACLALDGGALEQYMFGGHAAAFGVSMRTSGRPTLSVGNPIAQLVGQPPFIIKAPGFGGTTGVLRIGPYASELANYHTFQLEADVGLPSLGNGTSAWNDLAMPSCVDILSPYSDDLCASSLLDSGTSYMAVYGVSGLTYDEYLLPGDQLSVAMGWANDTLGTFDVTVGNPPQLGLDFVIVGPAVPGFGTTNVLGLPVFLRYDVLWDQAAGQVGLLAH